MSARGLAWAATTNVFRRLLLCLSVAAFAAIAQAQQQVVRLTVAAVAVGQDFRFDAVQSHAGDPDLTAIVLGALDSAAFPTNWHSDPNFVLRDGKEWSWLKERLVHRAVVSPSVKVRRVSDGVFNLIIGATVPTDGPKRGIALIVRSWAVTEPIDVPLTDFSPSALTAESGTNVEGDPASFGSLWRNSTIRIEPKAGRPATGQSLSAQRDLVAASGRLLEAVCTAYRSDMRPGSGYKAINSAVDQVLQSLLGSIDPSVTPMESIAGARLGVTVPDVDPVMGYRIDVPLIDLPAAMGGRMDVKAFKLKYGEAKIGLQLEKQLQAFIAGQDHALNLPAESFPRYMTDAERYRLLAILKQDRSASTVGLSRDASGILTFIPIFRPYQSALNVSLTGDSVRTLAGSLSWDKTWANGEAISMSGEYGTTSRSVAASYSHRTWQVSNASDFKLDYEANGVESPQTRLGNRTGPLIRRDDASIGVRGQYERIISRAARTGPDGAQWRQNWFYDSVLFAGYRYLRGHAPLTFLGGSTDRFAGPTLTHIQAIEFQDAPIVDPTASGTDTDHKRRRVRFTAGAKLQVDEFLPEQISSYTRGRLDLFLHQEFGTPTHSDYYLEGRWSGGLMSRAAPRLDLWRFGGQDLLIGLTDGELAGRRIWAGGLEYGWNLRSLLPKSKSKSSEAASNSPSSASAEKSADMLDGLFLFATAECGRVSDQSGAGVPFNPQHFASSYAIGLRLFGAIPTPAGDSSLSLGYGWSPESLSRSGRVFVRVVFHLGN